MDLLGTVVAFLAVLVVLVLVHELGHFALAKWAGITVEEFGIGFPPRIGSVRWRGTRYSVNWIPLGGFVKMLGEDGEIDAQRLRQQGLSEAEVDRAMVGAFNRKPIPLRLAVLFAGVLMNFVLGALLFAAALSLPQQVGYGPLIVREVQPGSPAEGRLEPGDRVVTADGRTFERSRDLTQYVVEQARLRPGEPVVLGVERGGEEIALVVTPRNLTPDQVNQGQGAIGFAYEPTRWVEEEPIAGNPIEALGIGFERAWFLATNIPLELGRAVGGILGLAPDSGAARGPIGIAEETGRVLDAPIVQQLIFVGLLSVNLAVLNVLPFPPLDGGRIAVTLLEAVRRRRLPAEREALIYLTGFAVLLVLVILISIQDVGRLLGG
ncbi:MAG TPA: M50 family metallopeptidase [Candidatus Limnocylindria bacterium]|nr:M50 family metallopeptidase [Candidatus Limnocylindria bacterium]